jgi:DNA topoisomerase-3
LRQREGDGWKEIFKVGRLMCQKPVTREHAIQLVERGKTDLIEGFTSKKGRPFDAFLMRQGPKINWEFPPRKPREPGAKSANGRAPRKPKAPLDLTKAVKLSESKVHDGDLYQTEDAFVVAKPQADGSPRVVFELKRNLCGKEIPPEEAERLVEMGKTGLIEGFVSKRGSNFGAYLKLSKDKKKAEFEFPPR